MVTVHLDLGEELVALLREQKEPIAVVVRELIVLELYRQGAVSRGKAAEFLGLSLHDFLNRTAALGIPYVEYTEEEWAAEIRAVEEVVREHRSSPTPAR
jgi:predicted HTH domain antitoxin